MGRHLGPLGGWADRSGTVRFCSEAVTSVGPTKQIIQKGTGTRRDGAKNNRWWACTGRQPARKVQNFRAGLEACKVLPASFKLEYIHYQSITRHYCRVPNVFSRGIAIYIHC